MKINRQSKDRLSIQINSIKNTEMIQSPFTSKWANQIALYSVCALAVSVNFGVALVSLSSLFIVLASIAVYSIRTNHPIQAYSDRRPKNVVYAVGLALIWMSMTLIWTESSAHSALMQIIRYCRILIIPIVFLLIKTPEQSFKILKLWVATQVFVIFCSYLLWMGLPVPWASNFQAELDLTPFTSTLEQPIMNTIMFAVVWNFRDRFIQEWGKPLVMLILALTLFEVFFIMIGRTGILCMLILLTAMLWDHTQKKYRVFIVLFPFIFFGALYQISSKVEQRSQEVVEDVIKYQNGDHNTSQGNRLEFSKRSIQAIIDKPILGYGAGSWPIAYKLALKGDQGKEGADNPHQQFLLWFVEGGLIAFTLLLNFYHSILRDAAKLCQKSKKTLHSVLIILFITSMMNCPLHGAGMSEFFCLIIALMLCFTTQE